MLFYQPGQQKRSQDLSNIQIYSFSFAGGMLHIRNVFSLQYASSLCQCLVQRIKDDPIRLQLKRRFDYFNRRRPQCGQYLSLLHSLCSHIILCWTLSCSVLRALAFSRVSKTLSFSQHSGRLRPPDTNWVKYRCASERNNF